MCAIMPHLRPFSRVGVHYWPRVAMPKLHIRHSPLRYHTTDIQLSLLTGNKPRLNGAKYIRPLSNLSAWGLRQATPQGDAVDPLATQGLQDRLLRRTERQSMGASLSAPADVYSDCRSFTGQSELCHVLQGGWPVPVKSYGAVIGTVLKVRSCGLPANSWFDFSKAIHRAICSPGTRQIVSRIVYLLRLCWKAAHPSNFAILQYPYDRARWVLAFLSHAVMWSVCLAPVRATFVSKYSVEYPLLTFLPCSVYE